MSGHSKWSTIKRKKGAADAKRGKIFTRIIKEITVAARMGGGDPAGNPRLRRAVDLAKANNMPADNVDRAIKKGTGELEGVQYEELVYEGVGPAGALVLMSVVTDNRNRTAAEIRKLFDKHGGQLGQSGSAAWAFDEKGVVRLPRDAATEEQLFEVAVGAGAEELEASDDEWIVTAPKDDLDAVKTALDEAGVTVSDVSLEQIPKTPKVLEGHDGEVLANLLDGLDDHDDVQKVWADAEPDEATLAALEAG